MKKYIVAVDDFANTLRVIEFLLQAIECEILKAKDGKEALSYFDGRHIDLLITDLNMPVMNGIELVKAVKEIKDYRNIPVIVLTAEKNPELKQEALKLNVALLIQKPLHSEIFLSIVKFFLQID
jgi:two-component system chemotaxis response regulator CheY